MLQILNLQALNTEYRSQYLNLTAGDPPFLCPITFNAIASISVEFLFRSVKGPYFEVANFDTTLVKT
jgi:hypothetical protein